MKKTLLFALGNFLLVIANAQSVGIGTTTPFRDSKLHIKSANTDTSFGVWLDGDTLGTALQIIRGATGMGVYAPIARLTVVTGTGDAEIDNFAAIFGDCESANSSLFGGVFGTYNANYYGVGVQGVGYGGTNYVNVFGDGSVEAGLDVGVHGSATAGVSGVGFQYGVIALTAAPNPDTLDIPETQYALFASSAGGSSAIKYAGFFDGNVDVTGELTKGSGTFKIDDPIDPANKYLYHSFVESPDMMNIYNGNITTDANGVAEVIMPAYFDALNKDFRYQLTSIGTFAQAIVKEEISGNHFTIQTSQPNVKVSWQVTGVRKDKFAEAHRVKAEVEKEPWNKGLYVHAKEFGMDISKSIGHAPTLKVPTVSRATATGAAPSLQQTLNRKVGQPTQIGNRRLVRFAGITQ